MARTAPSYDYVIVGAGTAGCVLAHRLSAEPGTRVLLLEAGPRDRHRNIHVPPGFLKLFRTELDWDYWTEEEPHLQGRRLYWPRGKVLGGSSSINAQLYVRGHRGDYDEWRDLGNPGWGYEDVLPYFKRGENQERGASDYHGAGGPLNVADPLDPNPLSLAFVDAGRELGWPANDDFNGARQTGVGLYQVNQKNGRRHSAAAAYVHPVRSRRNLTVRTGCRALRVVLEGRRAVGVEVREKGRVLTFRAEREVLLSGGTVNSPQLLMLSGIGPADHLRAHGLPVTADSPGVGRNLQDHVVVSIVCRARSAVSLDGAETAGNALRYVFFKRGPFTTSVCEGGAFVRTRPELPRPDLQFHFLPGALHDHGFRQAADRGFNFGPTLLRPESRGRLELASADPLAPIRIHAGYLAEDADVEVLVEGVRLCRRLARTRALAPHFDFEAWPGDGVESDAEIEEFVRRTAATLYHPVGTCRMGPDEGGSGGTPPVVDPQLRVLGVDGLRVVDASVMPRLVGGNTNAPTQMIAEKASDLILAAKAFARYRATL
jgi:choline dehydrogenase